MMSKEKTIDTLVILFEYSLDEATAKVNQYLNTHDARELDGITPQIIALFD